MSTASGGERPRRAELAAPAEPNALKPDTLPADPPLREVARQIAKAVADRDSDPRNFARGS